jgi:hypothetical protein
MARERKSLELGGWGSTARTLIARMVRVSGEVDGEIDTENVIEEDRNGILARPFFCERVRWFRDGAFAAADSLPRLWSIRAEL